MHRISHTKQHQGPQKYVHEYKHNNNKNVSFLQVWFELTQSNGEKKSHECGKCKPMPAGKTAFVHV